MVEMHIEYCGIQLVDVQYPYQVISALALAVVFFTNKHNLDFFFLYSSSILIVCMGSCQFYHGRTNEGIPGGHLSSLITLTVSRKA